MRESCLQQPRVVLVCGCAALGWLSLLSSAPMWDAGEAREAAPTTRAPTVEWITRRRAVVEPAVPRTGAATAWSDSSHDGGQNLTNVISLSAGYAHVCAVVMGGAAYCWGDNSVGELGTGFGTMSAIPVLVNGLGGAAAVSAGVVSTSGSNGSQVHDCAVSTIGSVQCWGENAYGQLGNGSTTSSPSPWRSPG